MSAWMKSSWFRYGFLLFFFIMFFIMLYNTCLVFAGISDMKEVVTLLWTVKVPWHWEYMALFLARALHSLRSDFTV